MSTLAIITTTVRISLWAKELRCSEVRKSLPRHLAESYPCQGSADCIIDTIWPPEPTNSYEIEDNRREKCASPSRSVRLITLSPSPAQIQLPFSPPRTESTTSAVLRCRAIFNPDGILARHTCRKPRGCIDAKARRLAPPLRSRRLILCSEHFSCELKMSQRRAAPAGSPSPILQCVLFLPRPSTLISPLE